jgi:hypothetical protein
MGACIRVIDSRHFCTSISSSGNFPGLLGGLQIANTRLICTILHIFELQQGIYEFVSVRAFFGIELCVGQLNAAVRICRSNASFTSY